jgi:hypothetical protein
MAGEVARLAIGLDSSGVSSGASGAASSLQAMKASFQSAQEEVRALQQAMQAMQKGGAAIDIKAFKGMQDQLTAAKAAASNAAQGFVKAGGSIKDLAAKPAAAADGMKALMDASKGALGPMGGLFEKINLLKGAFTGGGGLYAAAALAAVAVAALSAAVVVAIFKMAQFALVASDAAMKQRNLLEGTTGNAKAAAELAATIGRVTSAVPLATTEVQKLAQKLYDSGKRGSELERELMRASTAAAGLGKNPSAALLARSLLSLDVQTMKFKENLSKIFAGVKIEGFLKGLQQVLQLMDENSASGKALKAIVEVILNPLFDAASAIGPVVKRVFQGMVIGALLAAIAVLKLRNVLRDMIPQEVRDAMGKFETGAVGMWVAVGVGVAIVGILAVVLAGLSIVLVVIAVAMTMALAPLALLIAAFFILVAVLLAPVIIIALLIAYFDDLKAALSTLAAAGIEAATGLMSGLVNGILSGKDRVMEALRQVAAGAKAALMGALGIASPSKVFAELGVHTTAGFAQGVDSGAPAVQDSVNAMVSVPAAASSGSAGGGARTITIGQVSISGVKDAQELDTASFAQRMAQAIEAAMDGAGVPEPEPA